MVRINVEVDFDESKEHLEDMQKRIKDGFHPVWEWSRDELRKTFTENFTSNGLPVGGWAPLDADYAAWKISSGKSPSTLVSSGRLFRSMRSLRDRKVNILRRHSAQFGTAVPYAKFHQSGTKNMPKRQIAFIPEKFERTLGNKIAEYVTDGTV